ncbi:hypothetical protein BGZ70_009544, partial [Mortierella alpina]
MDGIRWLFWQIILVVVNLALVVQWIVTSTWITGDFSRGKDRECLAAMRRRWAAQEIADLFRAVYPDAKTLPSDLSSIERFLATRHPETESEAAARAEHVEKTGIREVPLMWLIKRDDIDPRIKNCIGSLVTYELRDLSSTTEAITSPCFPPVAQESLTIEFPKIHHAFNQLIDGRSYAGITWLLSLFIIFLVGLLYIVGPDVVAWWRGWWLTFDRSIWTKFRTLLNWLDLVFLRSFTNDRTLVEYGSTRIFGLLFTALFAALTLLPQVAVLSDTWWYILLWIAAGFYGQYLVQLSSRYVFDNYYLPRISAASDGVGEDIVEARRQSLAQWNSLIVVWTAWTGSFEQSKPLNWHFSVIKRWFTRVRLVHSALLPVPDADPHPNPELGLKLDCTYFTIIIGVVTCVPFLLLREWLGFAVAAIYYWATVLRFLHDANDGLQTFETVLINTNMMVIAQLPALVFGVLPSLFYFLIKNGNLFEEVRLTSG